VVEDRLLAAQEEPFDADDAVALLEGELSATRGPAETMRASRMRASMSGLAR
jgi:hypothetical protein